MNTLDLALLPATDPTNIYRHRDALYAADLLIAGLIHLDLFSWLNGRSATKEEICEAFKIQERPTDVMLTLFTAMGFLERNGDEVKLTALAAEHMVKGSPWFLGPYYATFKERPVAKDFLTVFQTGKPANWASLKGEDAWTKAMDKTEFALQFTSAMDCRGVYLGRHVAKALDWRRYRRLLDVAGGSGIYACCMAAANPHLKATVFERPPVDQVASLLIQRRGYASAVGVASGDMLAQPLPDGYDVHMYSNVLHDWDIPVVKQLLASSYASLLPGGLIIVHDAHINADKTGPLPVAEYSAMLMHASEGKCYSTAELERLLHEAGFVDVNFIPTVANRSVLTAAKLKG